MRIVWSVPVLAGRLGSNRGDLVRAAALVAALEERGHEVAVVQAAPSGAGGARSLYREGIRRLLPERAALALRDVGRRWAAGRHGRRVADAAREARARVVVETQVHGLPSGAAAARAARLPLVLDDVSPVAEERALGTGLPGMVERAFRRQLRAARILVVSSESLRERLAAEGAPSGRIAVVPNGVDLAAYRRTDRAAARRRLGLGDRIAVGFVGSFQPWHRVSDLVEAAAPLAAELDLHLLLAGEGPGREPALAAVGRLGLGDRVTAPGPVPPEEVPELLAACDLGVLPGTNAYGQPMKLLEYAAAGLAIVAPDLPPVREVVEDGATALLFDAERAGALRSALRRLATDAGRRRELGERARRRVTASAGWNARAALLEELLETAAEGRGAGEGPSAGDAPEGAGR